MDATQSVVEVPKVKRQKPDLAPVECWHMCPTHADMYPAFDMLTVAEQVELGVMWAHPVRDLAKLDSYEKMCPSCREEVRLAKKSQSEAFVGK